MEYCAQKDAYETDQTGNAIYGAETLATTKRQENRIKVTEMIMLKWKCETAKMWNRSV